MISSFHPIYSVLIAVWGYYLNFYWTPLMEWWNSIQSSTLEACFYLDKIGIFCIICLEFGRVCVLNSHSVFWKFTQNSRKWNRKITKKNHSDQSFHTLRHVAVFPIPLLLVELQPNSIMHLIKLFLRCGILLKFEKCEAEVVKQVVKCK